MAAISFRPNQTIMPQENIQTNNRISTRNSPLISKINKMALGMFAIYAISNVPTASAGLFSGLAALGVCVGAGIICPTSLFWAAAPCYDLTLLALANPLIP